MSKEFKKHAEWLEEFGYDGNAWIRGDWHLPMHFLSKLLLPQLSERIFPLENTGVSFKIAFDAMAELAEECLGIPMMVTEKDLMINFPNLFLAQLVQLVAMKHTLGKMDLDKKCITNVVAPKFVFEARNGMDAQFPRCPSCHDHVFFLQRLVVEKIVWHRQCFKCIICNDLLKSEAFKKTRNGYECIRHSVRRILDVPEQKKSPRPKIAPPPVPIALAFTTESSGVNDSYETLDLDTVSVDSTNTHHSKRSSVTSDEGMNEKKHKPVVPPKPKFLVSSKGSQQPLDLQESDSGVSIGSVHTYDTVEEQNLLDALKIREEKPPSLPIAPPRPKRQSMLLATLMTPPVNKPLIATSSPRVEPKPNPRTITKATSAKPRSSNPFEEEKLKVAFDYDESKNPFADSDEDEDAPIPAPRRTIPASLLPGESDRPKSQPPPPPITSTTPTIEEQEERIATEKLKTLRLSRKKKRAPLPPPLRRNIVFTENTHLEDAATIEGKIKKIDEDLFRVEMEGKKLEMELLLKITTNPKDWQKLPRTDEYITTAIKLLDILREQAHLQYTWKEAYLNEIHSETEFLLRSLVEQDSKDEFLQMREKQLLSLLVYIMDEKAKLTESFIEGSEENRSRDSSLSRKEKSNTMKLRMAILSKKLRSKKK